MTGSGRIVVGIDGSAASRDALGWALAEARRRGAVVEAVHVWHYPVWTLTPTMGAPTFAHADLEAEARAVLDEGVDEVTAGADPADLPTIERVALEGSAAEVLVNRAADADLLVVGHRGHGGFTGLLLGSVASQCTIHSPVPVVVVRHQ